ncbi:MAG: hypothetical protein JSW05_07790 [Candidatus Thorarchaeota archaeon]|nr:MAG: hypothetical protein JSW05_07790 [Candidatus Thorarchaeota archaeon]
MSERSREERFDEVFQMVLIVVALSFDIMWFFERIPIAEIAVFIFVLSLWGYGNLRGGIWEYPFKVGSFNLSIILLANFYVVAMSWGIELTGIWELALNAMLIPILCLGITLILVSYLRESLDRELTRGVLVGGTLGYIISLSLFLLFT